MIAVINFARKWIKTAYYLFSGYYLWRTENFRKKPLSLGSQFSLVVPWKELINSYFFRKPVPKKPKKTVPNQKRKKKWIPFKKGPLFKITPMTFSISADLELTFHIL